MTIGILGKKIGMTSVFNREGLRVPVTVIEAGPCFVTSVCTKAKEGYSAVQLAYGDTREKVITKPRAGFFKKNNIPLKRNLAEIRTDNTEGLQVGNEIRVDNFAMGDVVDVVGVSIGKGYQGVVKRHHFKGGPGGHGSMFGRAPGSIGSSAFPSRVYKGMRAGGHMGTDRVTIQNLPIIRVDLENNLIVVKGSVPGAGENLLAIRTSLKKGNKTRKWKPFTEQSIEIWKKEVEDLKAAEVKKLEEKEAKRKAEMARAAKKAATQAPGRGKK